MNKTSEPSKKGASTRAVAHEPVELAFSAEQDFAGEAQFARPAITQMLVRSSTWLMVGMVVSTLIVVYAVVRGQLAGDRVWASMPDGQTYELRVHADEAAAAAYEQAAAASSARRAAQRAQQQIPQLTP